VKSSLSDVPHLDGLFPVKGVRLLEDLLLFARDVDLFHFCTANGHIGDSVVPVETTDRLDWSILGRIQIK
jgi:hypothetical protein